MSRIFDEIRESGAYQASIEIAIRMIERNKYTVEEIADIVDLSLDKVKELAEDLREMKN